MNDFILMSGLFISALTSSTILPGTSELAFTGLIYAHPYLWLWAWLVASMGNSIGSLISYAMGRFVPKRYNINIKVQCILQQYGAWFLVLAWVPILGDALPIAAGWLRLNVWLCALALLIGKMARYGLIIWGLYMMGKL